MPKFLVQLSYDVRFTKEVLVEADSEDEALDSADEDTDFDIEQIDEWDYADQTKNASEARIWE